jgi:hypothetical protein
VQTKWAYKAYPDKWAIGVARGPVALIAGGGVMKCRKFDSCSAPICPADNEMKLRSYSKDDPICLLMLESVKPSGDMEVLAAIGGISAKVSAEATEWAKLTYSPIRIRLELASRTPSRLGGSDV